MAADETDVSPSGHRREMLRHLAPFGGAALAAYVLTASTADIEVARYAAALALTAVTVALVVALPWARLPTVARVLPSLVFLASAGLLRDSAGGIASGVGMLALLPVFWVALHGRRAELAVVLAATVVYFVGPTVLVGGAGYPSSGYRSTVLFVIVSGIVGLTVQRLVAQIRAHAEELASREHAVATVAAAARRLPTSPDARDEVCRTACEISGSRYAILLEPRSDERLASTAMAGIAAAPVSLEIEREGSGTAMAYRSRRTVFASDAAESHLVNGALWRAHGEPASMLFEPVLHGDAAVGVLTLGFDQPPATASLPLVKLLAAEAAVAIERADLLHRLGELALTDPLTGLPNRRALDTHLQHTLSSGQRVCVALLDLDHFKAFNDARGHQSGDRLLKAAAAAWRAELRPGDLLARYGGEEFAIVLPDCDRTSAVAVLERLRGATPGEQTCSAGMAGWDGAESADALIGRADEALYRAKDAGRDRTVAA